MSLGVLSKGAGVVALHVALSARMLCHVFEYFVRGLICGYAVRRIDGQKLIIADICLICQGCTPEDGCPLLEA